MKRVREVSKKLFIEELERPAPAKACPCSCNKGEDTVTTMAVGEECLKG